MAEHAVLFEHRQQRQLFKKQQDREPQSPQHERPRRPVPQARCKPDNQNVQQLTRLALPAAAERDIEVVAEPRAKRHVPPAPELRDAR